MNHFNICPSCMHRTDCVLTAHKDKVWSCSEYDAQMPQHVRVENLHQPKRALELV